MKIRFFALAALVLSLAACNNDNENLNGDPVVAQFTADIALATRASGTTWDNGDRIGITDTYVTSFQKMMRDDNFTVEELGAIAFGYTKLLEESNDVLTELKNVVNITTLSMTDKERMDVVERCYSKMKRYRNLVSYYTNKNISVSYLRAKKKNDLDRIIGLYGNMNERYW